MCGVGFSWAGVRCCAWGEGVWFLLKAVLKAPARFPGGEACRVRWVLPTISTSNGLHFHDGRDPFWDWLLTPVGNTIATWYSVPSEPRTKCAHNVRHNHKLYISTVAREMRFPPLLLTNGGAFCFDTFPTLDVCLGGQRSLRAVRAPHRRSRQRSLPPPPFPQPSTLNPQPATLNPQHSTLNTQPVTLNP